MTSLGIFLPADEEIYKQSILHLLPEDHGLDQSMLDALAGHIKETLTIWFVQYDTIQIDQVSHVHLLMTEVITSTGYSNPPFPAPTERGVLTFLAGLAYLLARLSARDRDTYGPLARKVGAVASVGS